MIEWRRLFGCLALLASGTLAACNSMPKAGPLSLDIETQSAESDYVVVDVDANIVQTLASMAEVGFHEKFASTGHRAPKQVVGVGDVLAVGITKPAKASSPVAPRDTLSSLL